MNAHVRNAGEHEARGQSDHLPFAWHREHDGIGAGTQVSRRAFARCVDDLRGLHSSREVFAHDDVMVEDGGRRRDAVTVAARA